MVRLDWLNFKNRVQAGNLNILEYEAHSWGYELLAYDGLAKYKCTIDEIDNAGSDKLDYETNFQPNLKPSLTLRDSDGAQITKPKTTQTGWHYEPRALDFYTSQLGSLYNRIENGGGIDDGTDYGDASLTFYDSSDSELVQGVSESDIDYQVRLTSSCVKTVINWQATYDFDIIGGNLQVKDRPASRAYIWCTVAPDIPSSLGGSVPYFAGGFNLNFFYNGQFQNFNGRGTKSFKYDPVYNSNKLRFTVKHAIGEQIGLQIILDQFKA